jgi:FKBP-type peptidyl-prolyl cis-trans isomerase SlyD
MSTKGCLSTILTAFTRSFYGKNVSVSHKTRYICDLSFILRLEMEIKEKRVAVVTYVLKGDDGQVIQAAEKDNPFAFIHGVGQVLPAFDSALLGKVAGDLYAFSLSAEDGYGEYDLSRIESLDPQIFVEAPAEYIVIGATLPMEFNGHTVFGTITEIRPDAVVMDFNHPLAGKNLHFSGEVIEVRDASAEELSHGHVHGPGGHHH